MWNFLTGSFSGWETAIFLCSISSLPATTAKDFEEWYPGFGSSKHQIWSSCVANANVSSDSDVYCKTITICILNNLTEGTKAAMAGTAVFLGFTSTMITLIGSVVSELGRLSVERPILSTLCACGMIGFSFTRSFEPFNTDLNLNEVSTERSKLHVKNRVYRKFSETMALNWSISCIQYVLATAAVVNTIHNAYEIGLRTVISFSCRGSYFLPLIWYCLTPAIQLLILFLVRIIFRKRQYTDPNVGGEKHSRRSSVMRSLQAWIRNEALLCSARHQIPHNTPTINPGGWREGLGLIVPWVINAILVAQFALGTIVMGSIIFVRTEDATVIVIRFLLSVLVARCVVAFEVEGLRYARHQWKESPSAFVLPHDSTNLCLRDPTAQGVSSPDPVGSSSTTTPDQSGRWTQTEDA